MSRALAAAVCVALLSQTLPAAAAAAPARTKAPMVVRLHIVANSNRPNDIAAKIAVRDALWNYMDSRLAAARTAQDEISALEGMTPALSRIAKDTLSGYGLRYAASVRLGTARLPARTYLGERLAGGRYATLLVVLGRGQGQNWWCLLFPQLCFSDQGAATGYAERHALSPTGFQALVSDPKVLQTPAVRPGGLIWSFWRHFHPQRLR